MAGRMAKGRRPDADPGRVTAPDGDDPRMELPADTVAGLLSWLANGEGRAGRRNAYRCDTCGLLTHTVDLHTGVTPAFLGCRRTEGCPGRGVSSGYPSGEVPANYPPAAWEWYRPSADEVRDLVRLTRDRHPLLGGPTDEARQAGQVLDHVARGGLLLRAVTT